MLQIDDADLNSYYDFKKSLDQMQKKQKKVTFQSEKEEYNLITYLSCFDLISDNETPKDHSNQRFYELVKNISFKNKQSLGGFLFNAFLQDEFKFDQEKFKAFLISIPLKKIQLLVISNSDCSQIKSDLT